MMFALAQRNGVTLPYANVEAIREAYSFTRLQDFLDLYYQGMSVLLQEQDFYDLTLAYLRRVARDSVRHVEIFFDPQGHTERGVAFATAFDGIERALQDGERELGITSKIILCFLRHLSADSAMATLEQAMDYRGRIAGVGLDSSEKGHPPEKFAAVFDKARAAGFIAEIVAPLRDSLGLGNAAFVGHAVERMRAIPLSVLARSDLDGPPLSQAALQGRAPNSPGRALSMSKRQAPSAAGGTGTSWR